MDTSTLNSIENELIIGIAGGLGVDFSSAADKVAHALAKAGYHVEIIRISDNFITKDNSSPFIQCYWKMQYATKQRVDNGNDFWAKKVISKIFNTRPELSKKHKKIAYIVRSLKNKDELELLSNVYGRNFISMAIFSENETSMQYLQKKLKLGRLKVNDAREQMQLINTELGLGADIDIENLEEVYLDDYDSDEKATDQDKILKFLMRKDQAETHQQLKKHGQNLFKCYSRADFFLYENKNLERQIKRFVDLLFGYPFAEPTAEEYFMFCAQATAYRSLDLDRQVGAVIVNGDNELVASGFNDVSKVGGGHFAHHDHPMEDDDLAQNDYRDFKLKQDYNHTYLDHIVNKIAKKLGLNVDDQQALRDEITGITEFKRSTHAEMSALLDASRRGVSVKNCTMYVNYYPCHNCSKHIIAAGIKKIIFVHPYTKSKTREMYYGMIKHGLFDYRKDQDVVVLETFLGVAPGKFMQVFANDKDNRLERENDRETGKISDWTINTNSIPRELRERQPHSYMSREWAVINNKLPDMSAFYD